MAGEMRKRRRWRWTAQRRARLIELVEESGNLTASAEAVGTSYKALHRLRLKDPEFRRRCDEAARSAHERLAKSEAAFETDGDEFQAIRRTSNGRYQLTAVPKRHWTKRTEDEFFGYLRETGNISAAARSVGSDKSSVFRRCRKWPGFARRWDEVLEEASMTLEFRLACQDGAATGGAGDESAADAAAEAGRAKFDPELALRFLKWRHEKLTGRARRRGSVPAPPSIEEVTEKIVRQVEAIKRHRARGGQPPRSEGGDAGSEGSG